MKKRRKTKGSDKVLAHPQRGANAAKVNLERLIADGVRDAKIGGFDIDGVLRGKYVSLSKLESALKKGFGFCDVIFGWDVADALYKSSKLTGWHTGYPDAHAVLDPATLRRIPWEPRVLAMLCDFRDRNGEPHPACPRSLLKRVLAHGEKLGFSTTCGVEFEFFLFRETRDSLRQKRFTDLQPLDPGMFGYSWLRTGQDSELVGELLEACRAFNIHLEGLHTETGPGVYEVAVAAGPALEVADQAALFKTLVKELAHRHGLAVTFMAKWNEQLPGSSGHLHLSLNQGGKNAFFDPRAEHGMSKVMSHFLGGQMALMREFTALVSPTVNSYKRYVPGLWAPLVASWGVENRTCALRVIGRSDPKALHVEHRQGAADLNPYIAVAACLGAGLWGLTQKLPPGPPTQGDAGGGGPGALPRSLERATELLDASKAARALFGDAFVDHYVMTRRWEVSEYDKAVTDWELRRYFESI